MLFVLVDVKCLLLEMVKNISKAFIFYDSTLEN